jgi:MYXO-CTERM domain-containing protein
MRKGITMIVRCFFIPLLWLTACTTLQETALTANDDPTTMGDEPRSNTPPGTSDTGNGTSDTSTPSATDTSVPWWGGAPRDTYDTADTGVPWWGGAPRDTASAGDTATADEAKDQTGSGNEDGGGCGCETGGAAPSAMWIAALVLLTVRRRNGNSEDKKH